jgi:hypothetical protein
MDDQTLLDLFASLSREIGEVKSGVQRVEARFDRMDATLISQGKLLAAGSRAIAGFTEWMGKADADYTRVLQELADLKVRMAKLEEKAN